MDRAAIPGGVDRVLALNVLHELGAEVLRNLGRLLRPGGIAVVADSNSDVERPHPLARQHTCGIN